MKKTSSFNLEERTYDEIIEYKETHKLSSRNAALEMMLTERRTMLKMIENRAPISNISPVSNTPEIIKSDKSDILDESIADSFSSMPD